MIALSGNKNYLWRNIYAECPVHVIELSLTGAAGWTAAALADDLRACLRARFPGLADDAFGLGAAAFTAAIAQQIQGLHDPAPPRSGVHAVTADGASATIFFASRDAALAAVTAKQAVQLADALVTDGGLTRARLETTIDAIEEEAAKSGLSPAARALAAAAMRWNIPWFRIGGSPYLQLGQSSRQMHMRGTLGGNESAVALALAANNYLSLRMLARIDLPAGPGALVRGAADAVTAAESIGYPLAVKRATSIERGGSDPTAANADELRAAVKALGGRQTEFVLQRLFPGRRHLILVAGNRIVAAAAEPAAPDAALTDVTDTIHPVNAEAAVRAAAAIGLKAAVVDFRSPDIARPWPQAGGGIYGIGGATDLSRHWFDGSMRDVAGPILETVFAPGDDGRIPTAMITGTKGKTTTTLMLSSILTAAGHKVGAATSDGVFIGGTMVGFGDAAAAMGAETVIRDGTVTAAALETARGGLILRGIYLDRCDVAALLNVGREQTEIDGIETPDDMLRLKRKVLDSATKAVVLNADDARCAAVAGDFPDLRKIFFSIAPEPPPIPETTREGATVLSLKTVKNREFVFVADSKDEAALIAVDELPSTMGGIIRCNIANAMAAAGLALGLGLSREAIVGGLRVYDNSLERTYGRFSFLEGAPVPTLFDRPTGTLAVAASVEAIDKMNVAGRRICALTAAGNRPDWHFTEMAETVAGHFNFFICFERPDFLRGRAPGEISRLIREALIAAGVPPESVATAATNREAAERIAGMAQAEDLVTVFYSDITTSPAEFREAYARHRPDS